MSLLVITIKFLVLFLAMATLVYTLYLYSKGKELFFKLPDKSKNEILSSMYNMFDKKTFYISFNRKLDLYLSNLSLTDFSDEDKKNLQQLKVYNKKFIIFLPISFLLIGLLFVIGN